jgi:hypothetical protein
MTNEARTEVSPLCTTPRNNGGDQAELNTWPCSTQARACFITSQPAAWLKKDSSSSMDMAAQYAVPLGHGSRLQISRS